MYWNLNSASVNKKQERASLATDFKYDVDLHIVLSIC